MGSRRRVTVVCVTAAALIAAGSASADRATLTTGSVAPWSGGSTVVTPLETVASRIASRIAGHAVSVRCEAAQGFRAGGRDATGYVSTLVDARTRRYTATAAIIELSSTTCAPLQQFAQAATKPTRCAGAGDRVLRPCFIGVPTARGSGSTAICSATTCFSVVSNAGSDYWTSYGTYARAIKTLAHEAIHTSQAVAGYAVPDLVEARAECSGMQWMRWVAGQLGAADDDARAIASFYWLVLYPLQATQNPEYWSRYCGPGGSLDIRGAGAIAWP